MTASSASNTKQSAARSKSHFISVLESVNDTALPYILDKAFIDLT